MFQYRRVLVHMREGDTDREIARAGLMGRRKAARLHALAAAQGGLEARAALPDDAAIAAVVGALDPVQHRAASGAGRALGDRDLQGQLTPPR